MGYAGKTIQNRCENKQRKKPFRKFRPPMRLAARFFTGEAARRPHRWPHDFSHRGRAFAWQVPGPVMWDEGIPFDGVNERGQKNRHCRWLIFWLYHVVVSTKRGPPV
jgi:hypothetical protein